MSASSSGPRPPRRRADGRLQHAEVPGHRPGSVPRRCCCGILGRFEVFGDDGTPLDVGGAHPRTVGAALVAAGGRAVSSDVADRVDLGRRAAGLAGGFAADLRLAAAASPPRRLAGVGVARLPVARRPRRGRRLALRGHRRPGACRAPGRRPDGGSGAAGGGRPPVAGPRTAGGARARRLPRPGEPARGAPARGPRAPLRGRAADRPARAGRGGAGRGGDRPSVPRGAAGAAGAGAVPERAPGRGAALDLERPIHVRRGARHRPRRRAATARVGGARSRSRRSTWSRRRRCARRSRHAAAPRPASTSALVGRQAELDVLASALDDARHGPRHGGHRGCRGHRQDPVGGGVRGRRTAVRRAGGVGELLRGTCGAVVVAVARDRRVDRRAPCRRPPAPSSISCSVRRATRTPTCRRRGASSCTRRCARR